MTFGVGALFQPSQLLCASAACLCLPVKPAVERFFLARSLAALSCLFQRCALTTRAKLHCKSCHASLNANLRASLLLAVFASPAATHASQTACSTDRPTPTASPCFWLLLALSSILLLLAPSSKPSSRELISFPSQQGASTSSARASFFQPSTSFGLSEERRVSALCRIRT